MTARRRAPRLSYLFWCLCILLSLALAGCDMAGGGVGSPPAEDGSGTPGSPDAPAPSPGEGGEDSGGGGQEGPAPTPGQLTAGEWRDLDNWPFWLALMDKQEWSKLQAYWSFYPTERLAVRVVSGAQDVSDARVVLEDAQGTAVWEARTDAQGRADVFFKLLDEAPGPYALTITAAGSTETVANVSPGGDEVLEVDLPAAPTPSNTLDLMFVVDTTGSMGDELEYLKVELQDVIDRVEAASNQTLDLRLSVNFYRDRGDEYVVRSFPFSTDVPAVLAQLAAQRSDGGGDYPEAVEAALEDAIDGHRWSADARARLLFLVLDAPPHHQQDILGTLQDVTRSAARQGIHIIPVASSGVDKETEFLLRFLGISTGGSYVFLTDDSGIGNDHIEPTIGQYEVELLNDLLVRMISGAVTSF